MIFRYEESEKKLHFSSSHWTEFPDITEYENKTEEIYIYNVPYLKNIPNLSNFKNLKRLFIIECNCYLCNIPELENLEELTICTCSKLQSIPDLSKCKNLKKFNLSFCDNIRKFPNLSMCENLNEITTDYYWSGNFKQEKLKLIKLQRSCRKFLFRRNLIRSSIMKNTI
jgi:Leucine-rich repeat (LRR) protein